MMAPQERSIPAVRIVGISVLPPTRRMRTQ
jgi:hypothetical protein